MKKRFLAMLLIAAMTAAAIPVAAYAEDAGNSGEVILDSESSEEQVPTEEDSTEAEDSESKIEELPEEKPADTKEDTSDSADSVEETEEPTEEAEEELEDSVVPASGNVVTLGENLNEEQRQMMYDYFGTSPEEVTTIVVTHEDEVRYMEGIATAQQIGATTNSCAYVEPTESGGIKVKTANLNFVTSEMIASTLTTAGMEHCNVVAACPFEVSGTGALTGIIMAYESASGETLEEGKKEAAMEEMVLLGELAELVGEETATELMNKVKTEIIDKGITSAEEIGAFVDKTAEEYGAVLTEEQRAQIVELMQLISKYDYDLGALRKTLDHLNETVGGLTKAWNNIKSFFFGSGDGILTETNDEVLGEDVITDSNVAEAKYADGLLTRIIHFFTGE